MNNLQLNDMGVAQCKEIAEGKGCREHWVSGLVYWYEAGPSMASLQIVCFGISELLFWNPNRSVPKDDQTEIQTEAGVRHNAEKTRLYGQW